ncbi:MAG: hypothetical protein EOR84_34275 [Mesorhizobium sp.]|uniref:hypothetical protein n=1 Tax=Mesorhizobium sp. TaxID=1871066 RepID=UPI000FE5D589|nr:hypothetical protein [Mesorhizobium sp.]RWM82849.1 MAG: hypothetical protein EOR84_34275 [Mesorhizobium sp.]
MQREQKRDREDDSPNISKTTGVDSRHERRKARPDADDLTDPEEVWKSSETTPQREAKEKTSEEPDGRVADAGDVGGGQPSPYETEVQADSVAQQADRNRRTGEKPKP